MDRAGVVRDVIALPSVAAGDRLPQNALFVDECQRDAVDLVFDGIGQLFNVEPLAEPFVEFHERLFIVDVVDMSVVKTRILRSNNANTVC